MEKDANWVTYVLFQILAILEVFEHKSDNLADIGL